MIIPIHEAWDRQPPAGTPIDHRLFPPSAIGGYCQPREILMRSILPNGANTSYFGASGLSNILTPFGVLKSYAGGGYGSEITSNTGFYNNDVTALACFYKRGAASGLLISSSGVSSQANGAVMLNTDNTLAISANGDMSFTTAAVADGLHVVVLTNNRTAGVQRVYIDGRRDSAQGASTAHKGFPTSKAWCGNNWSGSAGVAYFFVVAGILSEPEIVRRSANPWQIFQP